MIAQHHSKLCFDFRQSYNKAHRQLQEALCPLYSMLSVGLQGSCILFLDHDRFDLAVGGRQRLF
jgi:hypothetical protein